MTLRKLRKRLWLDQECLDAAVEYVLTLRHEQQIMRTNFAYAAMDKIRRQEERAALRAAGHSLVKIRGYLWAVELIRDEIEIRLDPYRCRN